MFKAGPDFMVEGGKDWSCLKSMETLHMQGEARQANERNEIKTQKQLHSSRFVDWETSEQTLEQPLQRLVACRAASTSTSRTLRSKQSPLSVVLQVSYGLHTYS